MCLVNVFNLWTKLYFKKLDSFFVLEYHSRNIGVLLKYSIWILDDVVLDFSYFKVNIKPSFRDEHVRYYVLLIPCTIKLCVPFSF